MRRHESNTRVGNGYYFNTTSWALHAVDDRGGTLPGATGTRWVRLNGLLMIIAAAVVSFAFAFVLFLPVVGIALFAMVVTTARPLRAPLLRHLVNAMTPARPARLRRTVQTLLLLLAVGVTLRLADCGPRAAFRARDVRELPNLEAAEHAARRHLALPAWYPKSLPWPPTRVMVVGAGPDAVALQLGRPDGGSPEVVLAQAFEGPVPLPPEFFPPALPLETRTVQLPGGPARLTRLRGDDGAAWHELAWEEKGRAFTFRSRGSVDQLFDLSASVRWEGGE